MAFNEITSYQRKHLLLHRHAHIALTALVCAQRKGSEKDIDLTAKYHVMWPVCLTTYTKLSIKHVEFSDITKYVFLNDGPVLP